MKISINQITDKQVLDLGKALLDYEYIQNHCGNPFDKDFQDVYYSFYLKARWAQLGGKGGSKCGAYFNVLNSINGTELLEDVLEELIVAGVSDTYEFSIGSKLLHTKNPNSPIFDSKVYSYLTKDEGLQLQYRKALKNGQTKLQQIQHDWEIINDWYNNLIKNDPRGKQWIAWFDNKFPQYKGISDVKKIDFLIFIFN